MLDRLIYKVERKKELVNTLTSEEMAAAAGACLPLVPQFFTSGCGSNAITRCSSSSPMRSTTTTSNVIFHNYDYCYKPSSMIRSCRRRRVACYSAASSTSAGGGGGGITEFDLYELMGIDSSCDPSEIKRAYRTLQKRCHPDIAGPAGHDMAIILNEAYALLSDPNSRSAYDKVYKLLINLLISSLLIL